MAQYKRVFFWGLHDYKRGLAFLGYFLENDLYIYTYIGVHFTIIVCARLMTRILLEMFAIIIKFIFNYKHEKSLTFHLRYLRY